MDTNFYRARRLRAAARHLRTEAAELETLAGELEGQAGAPRAEEPQWLQTAGYSPKAPIYAFTQSLLTIQSNVPFLVNYVQNNRWDRELQQEILRKLQIGAGGVRLAREFGELIDVLDQDLVEEWKKSLPPIKVEHYEQARNANLLEEGIHF